MKRLEKLVNPSERQEEVAAFAQFLVEKRRKKSGQTLRQDWVGAQKTLCGHYTAVERQHKIGK